MPDYLGWVCDEILIEMCHEELEEYFAEEFDGSMSRGEREMKKSKAAAQLGFHGNAGELDRHLRNVLNKNMDTGLEINGNPGELLIKLYELARRPIGNKKPISVKSERNSRYTR